MFEWMQNEWLWFDWLMTVDRFYFLWKIRTRWFGSGPLVMRLRLRGFRRSRWNVCDGVNIAWMYALAASDHPFEWQRHAMVFNQHSPEWARHKHRARTTSNHRTMIEARLSYLTSTHRSERDTNTAAQTTNNHWTMTEARLCIQPAPTNEWDTNTVFQKW